MAPADELQEQMVALVRAFGLLRPEQTPCGQPISVSSAHALMELAPDRLLVQSELTSRLRLEKSTISRLVQDLERRGWVKRERCAQDGRARLLRLTDDGVAVARRLAEARARKFAAIAAAIPAVDQEVVFRGLATLVRAINQGERGEQGA